MAVRALKQKPVTIEIPPETPAVLRKFIETILPIIRPWLVEICSEALQKAFGPLFLLQSIPEEMWVCSVPEAAKILKIDRNRAYEEIHKTGTIRGIPVLPGKPYRVSKLALAMRLMGEKQDDAANTVLPTERNPYL